MNPGPFVRDVVQRPAPVWWMAIGGGLGLLGVIALVPSAYGWWEATATALFSQATLRIIFALAIATHAAEAFFAYRFALRQGLTRSAPGWALQTFLLGFPSFQLLRRQATR
jgi:uncharacterized membrane protein YbhN (UPF0104 family)